MRFVFWMIRSLLGLRKERADVPTLQAEAIEQAMQKRISVELKPGGVPLESGTSEG